MRDISFGQYYPTNSIIHRLDARIKLIITILYMVSIFFVVSYTAYMVIFLGLITITLVSRIPVKTLFRSVKAILLILFFTSMLNLFFFKDGKVLCEWWIFRITDRGIDFAVKMILRLALLVMGSSLLTFTTTPTELTDAIEYLLTPLKLVKVPVHDIALIMSIALRFIPGLIDETDKIMMAQKARGANLDTGNFFQRIKAMLPILIPLLVGAFRHADELADALDARCYSASPKRTKMKVFHLTFKDFVAMFLMIALTVLIMLEKYLVGGSGFFVGMDRIILACFGIQY
ncbi:MAG: energy-coupling factor transporter transmembrane component T [Clostridia bacterium]